MTVPLSVRSVPRTLARRWPTALGVLLGATVASDITADADLLPVIVLMALVYVAVAATGRSSTTWVVAVVCFTVGSAVPGLGVPFPAVVAALSAVVAAVAIVRVRSGAADVRAVAVQSVQYVFFGAAAGLAVTAPTVTGWVLAVLVLAHGMWDVLHLVRRRTVSPSYAEFCAAIDLVVGFALLTVLVAAL